MSDEPKTDDDGVVVEDQADTHAAQWMVGSNLVRAVCGVMEDVQYVKKGGKVQMRGGGYSYASDADILAAIQPALVKHGLMLAPIKIDFPVDESLVVVVTYSLRHTSGESMTLMAPGSGSGNADKAVYVAMTGAFKYVLRQTFAIPTGDDPEKAQQAAYKKQEQKEDPCAALKKHWFARLRALHSASAIPTPNTDEGKANQRHTMQGYFFEGKTSLKNIFANEAAIYLQKMQDTNDADLAFHAREALGIPQ